MPEQPVDAPPLTFDRTPGWSCPFCDAENPRGGHELSDAIGANEVELSCDYCGRISVHSA